MIDFKLLISRPNDYFAVSTMSALGVSLLSGLTDTSALTSRSLQAELTSEEVTMILPIES